MERIPYVRVCDHITVTLIGGEVVRLEFRGHHNGWLDGELQNGDLVMIPEDKVLMVVIEV